MEASKEVVCVGIAYCQESRVLQTCARGGGVCHDSLHLGGEQERKIAVNLSKALLTLSYNVIWRILARRTFTGNELGSDFTGFHDLLLEVTTTMGAFDIGDFIPYLDCLDLQGIKRRMKKIHKAFDEFAEKIIDDHVAHRLAGGSNCLKDEEPHVKDFVDVLLQKAETDTKITRETIKALVLVSLSVSSPILFV